MRLEINGVTFSNFNNYEINLMFNAVASSFKFTAQYDFIDKLIDYPVCYIYNDAGELLIKGTVLPPTLKSSSMPETTTVQGYSSSGVLEDCQMPVSLYPLQFDGMNLAEITDRLLSAFLFTYSYSDLVKDDLFKVHEKVQAKLAKPTQTILDKITDKLLSDFSYNDLVKDDLFKVYEKVSVNPTQTIKEFLTQLATERNIILSNNNDGSLLFTRLDTTRLTPVDTFEVGKHGIKKMALQINGQKLHNPIWVIGQAGEMAEGDATEYMITNPYVAYFRPKVVVAEISEEFDAKKTARNELGKELGNILLTFETTKFNKPGQLILVQNADLKINNLTEFFIQSVKIKGGSNDVEMYTYICVLKDVYTDNDVINILK